MSLERFVKANLLVLPIVLVVGYFYLASLPVIVLPIGVAYVTASVLLTFAWIMSRLSLRLW
ncbi:hypothetical protein [Natrarchaeobaculum aegyptiacum]|uniref:Uncharacterized protein n=1 Tax=Natrarchaeobaculum aegyptiacum TaxID=745377 RepID=A0A2Z2HZZ4_9EURY|nr:hypothetical protein [Natrarchaeobaculum aegyptiacum]ARS91647.1 hypothetical protein B1756_02985 [Natrarchaeobaculum aegyptiacum]